MLQRVAKKTKAEGDVMKYSTGKFAKGGYVFDNPDRARGGPPVTQHSRFMKTPDPFRTSIEEQNYGKSGPEGMPDKDKSLKPVVPRT